MERSCGDCTLCCTVTHVPELAKPVGTTCSNCAIGCTIYNTRPQSCRTFNCAWLQGDMSEDMKPNKSHIVIEKLPNVPVVIVLIEPGYAGIWLTPAVDKVLKEYQQKGVAVVATDSSIW